MKRFFRLLDNPWILSAAGLAAILIRGLFIDLMDVDASQYGSISMEMFQNGSWLQVMHRGGDYLDKPPLLFWSAAMSYLIFGVSTWAYKLPSLLGALAGIYAVYRFCRLYYNPETAMYAAFILASSLGLTVICNDVRTDTLLLGMTACAVWQLAAFMEYNNRLNLAGAFFFAALAMLAKGPIGLVMPAFAAGTHVLLKRDWRQIFRWEWIAGLLLVGLVLAPMCWGLYHQFDLHPEKTINDRTGVSGLYFFFWEQSFGRITGENAWKNDTTVLYFTHVYLWAFLPWSILLIGALWKRFKTLVHDRFRLAPQDEAYSLGGFVLTFAALSLSKYKLPHYIFITLPWASVLTARWIASIDKNQFKRIFAVQYLVCAVLITGAWIIPGFIFPNTAAWIWVVLVLMTGYLVFVIVSDPVPASSGQLVWRSVLVAIIFGFSLNFDFYPNLLPYQSTSRLMHEARDAGIPIDKIVWYKRHGHSLDFYNGRILQKMETPDQIQQTVTSDRDLWVYTDEHGKNDLDSSGIRYNIALNTGHFQVALLKLKFLDPASRAETLDPVYLLKILPDQNH